MMDNAMGIKIDIEHRFEKGKKNNRSINQCPYFVLMTDNN